jgi:hypothetical protein
MNGHGRRNLPPAVDGVAPLANQTVNTATATAARAHAR